MKPNVIEQGKFLPVYRPGDSRPLQKQNKMEVHNAVIVDDQYDIAMHIAQVHSPYSDFSSDFVMASLTPGQVEYITEMHKVGILFRDDRKVIADPQVGDRIYKFIILDSASRAILARNKEGNSLVKWILGVMNPPKESDGMMNETMAKRMWDRVTGKKDKEEKSEKDE